MGKRRFKFTYRKNEEHIKHGKCLRVSIPLDRITVCTCDTPSLVVSYDLKHVPVSSVDSLKQQLTSTSLPPGLYRYNYVESCTWCCNCDKMELLCSQAGLMYREQRSLQTACFSVNLGGSHIPEVMLSLVIHQDFTWHLSFRDKTLDPNTLGLLKDASCTLCSANDVVSLLELVNSYHICVGNPNMQIHHTTFMDPTGDYINAYFSLNR